MHDKYPARGATHIGVRKSRDHADAPLGVECAYLPAVEWQQGGAYPAAPHERPPAQGQASAYLALAGVLLLLASLYAMAGIAGL